MNLERRHLTLDQLAFITVEKILPLIEERARKRQLEGKKIEDDLMHETVHKVEKGLSRKIVAKKLGTSKNTIQIAKKVKESDDKEIKQKWDQILPLILS